MSLMVIHSLKHGTPEDCKRLEEIISMHTND